MNIVLQEKESINLAKKTIESVKVLPSSTGKEILIACRDKRAYIVSLSDDLAVRSSLIMKAYEDVHIKRITDVAYSSEGDKIITVSSDNQLVFWDKENKTFQKFKGHDRNITSVALNAKNNKIVTASEDSSIIVWNTLGEKVTTFDKLFEHSHKSWVNAIGFVPNIEDTLVSAGEDGTVKMWDLEMNKLTKTFFNGSLVDYEKAKETKSEVKDFDFELSVKAIAFSKDGSLLAYGGRNSKVYLLNLADGEFLQTINVADKVIALAYGENQPLLAISIPNKILLWNIIENKMAAEYIFGAKGESYCKSLVFLGDEIIAGLDNGVLKRLELSRN
ncbi:Guanine nucleotide-binding protein subunit beta-2-like 1 [Glugoides intestinalis]